MSVLRVIQEFMMLKHLYKIFTSKNKVTLAIYNRLTNCFDDLQKELKLMNKVTVNGKFD